MAEGLLRREAQTLDAPGDATVPRHRGTPPGTGVPDRLHDLTVRAANRLVVFKILQIMAVERVHPEFLRCPAPYLATFLDEKDLREHGRNPDNELPARFLDEALGKGDQCLGILVGDTLAAYGWYAFGATRIHPRDLVLRVSSRYVYMYKGFTHPAHRGQRLYAIGMTLALQHYQARGYAGMVSYAESNNFRAIHSTRRMGYEALGAVAVLRLFGVYVTRASPGCRRLGLRIEPADR